MKSEPEFLHLRPIQILDEDDDDTCLSRKECIEDLFRDAPEGCVYCAWEKLTWDDDRD